ncbi:MAG: hypothetical protein WBQ94_00440 [Terracidiphilus sp.]
MDQQTTAIERFFHDFERNSETLNTPAIVSQFADVFFAAGPQGAQCVRVTDFASALPKRKQIFDSLGLQTTSLASLQINRFDSRYAMAHTQWQMTFVDKSGDKQQVLTDSFFIIDTAVEGFKIILYLASQDPTTLLKNRGISPV